VPTKVQVNKFKLKNLVNYVSYLENVRQIPWGVLRFCDEAHVVPRQLNNNTKVLGIVGQRTWVKAKDLHGKSCSLTILTGIGTKLPIAVGIREESNNQWDFFNFITFCCVHGHLRSGDILVVDNSFVHGATDSLFFLIGVLDKFNVQLRFLPKYSPELNPAELVFNILKNYLRYRKNLNNSLTYEILCGLSKVNEEMLTKFYDRCINLKNIFQKCTNII